MKALVIIDMQNDFVTGPLGSPEAQTIIPRIADRIAETKPGTRIFFTRDTHPAHYLDTLEGKHLPVPHCIKDTPGWHVCPELVEAYRLYTYGAAPEFCDKSTFGSTQLMYRLAAMENESPGLDEIILCGVCTDICVVTNALHLKTWFPEIPITVDAALCAGTTPENHHAALRTMRQCQINVINWEENT